MSIANKRDFIFFNDRQPCMFLTHGKLFVKNGSVKFSSKNEEIDIPIGIHGCLFLEPGTSITHEVIKLCAEERCGLYFIGDNGLKFYSIGYLPDGIFQNQIEQFKNNFD
jgi:CRISPR-associated protein Cas1